jgi:nucleotide-binding universal stress UspA family protein
MIVLKSVLIATDFGEAGGTALLYGRQLARTFNAVLHLVHVTDDLNARAIAVAGFPEYLSSMSRLQVDANAQAETRLAGLLSDEDRQLLGARTIVLTAASPAQAIVQYARHARIDLIVTGTHGRGAIERAVLGSVADRIVRTAPCPVLTVRHPQHDFVRADALEPVSEGPIPGPAGGRRRPS